MAEEEAVEESAAPAAGGGGSVKKYAPLIVIVLLAQVVLAWVVIQFVLKDNVPERENFQEELFAQETVLEVDGEDITFQNLPYYLNVAGLQDITVNPAGDPNSKRKRFAVVSIELGLVGTNEEGEELAPEDIGSDAEGAAKVNQYSGLVEAIIIEVMRSKTIPELGSDQIPAVQEEIKKRLNKEVFQRIFKVDKENKKEIKVKEVIFTKIIIQ